MATYTHSVSIDPDKCTGCTTCLRRCPVEAIRIRGDKAQINELQCIDCGECIRVCKHNAKHAVYDRLEELDWSKYLVALPAPSLFGQFNNLDDADYVIQGLLDMGFKEVYEVAKAAEYVTDLTRIYLKQPGIKLPAISSACPAVVRLIKLRFPTLCEQLIPTLTPFELAGKFAREKVLREHPELDPADVQTVFISPCPAKVSWAKSVMEGQNVYVDRVVSMNDVYMELLSKMKDVSTPSAMADSEAGNVGLGWSITTGEAVALMNDAYLAADGIDNVIKVLDDLESGTVSGIEFVELNACSAGCVGGVLAPANGYIARVRLHNLRKTCAIQPNRLTDIEGMDDKTMPAELVDARPFTYMPEGAPNMLSMLLAMQKANALVEKLPNKDCGACGSPTCRAFAMDVVNGEAQLSDCKIRDSREGS